MLLLMRELDNLTVFRSISVDQLPKCDVWVIEKISSPSQQRLEPMLAWKGREESNMSLWKKRQLYSTFICKLYMCVTRLVSYVKTRAGT